MIRVAINGFGRIGRLVFRECLTGTTFDLVAINSTKSAEELAYLAKYDTVHRSFHEDEISSDDNNIIIANKKSIKVFTEKEPENWRSLIEEAPARPSGGYDRQGHGQFDRLLCIRPEHERVQRRQRCL